MEEQPWWFAIYLINTQKKCSTSKLVETTKWRSISCTFQLTTPILAMLGMRLSTSFIPNSSMISTSNTMEGAGIDLTAKKYVNWLMQGYKEQPIWWIIFIIQLPTSIRQEEEQLTKTLTSFHPKISLKFLTSKKLRILDFFQLFKSYPNLSAK